MSKGLKKFIIIAIIIILVILSGIMFVKKILPKIMTNYLTSENAPEFMGDLNTQIKQNALIFNQVLKENGISNDQAVQIIKGLNYKDLEAIQSDLQFEGFNDNEKCAEIIVSHIGNDSVDKEKMKKLIIENITPAMLENGINQLSDTKPVYVKMILPSLQEIAVKSLMDAEKQP